MEGTETRPRTPWPRILYATALIVLIVFFVQANGKATRQGGNDYSCYHRAAQITWQGQSPFQTNPDSPFPYIYPPFFLIFMLPFSLIPQSISFPIWFLINVLALALSVRITLSLIFPPRAGHDRVLLATLSITLILFIEVMQNHLLNGQVNFIVLLTLLLTLHFHHHKRSLWAGFFLAIGISIKLIPMILFIYLLFRKWHRTISWALLFLALFTLSPWLIFTGAADRLYPDFIMTLKTMTHLHGVNEIYFTPNIALNKIFPFTQSLRCLKYVNALTVGLMLIFIEKLLIRAPRVQAGPICLYLLAIPLISPMSETHHLVYLIVPFLCSLYQVLNQSHRLGTPLVLGGIAWGAFIIGHDDKRGPFFFISIVTLTAFFILSMIRGSTPIKTGAAPQAIV